MAMAMGMGTEVASLAMALRISRRLQSMGASPGFQDLRRRRFGILVRRPLRCFACPAVAATWEIVPTLTIDETYTDNVRLSAPGSERSDWVTTLNPGLIVRGNGDRLRLDIAYSPLFLYRAREGSSDVIHQLNARAPPPSSSSGRCFSMCVPPCPSRISPLSAPRPTTTSTSRETVNRSDPPLINPFLRHDFGLDAREARLSYSTVNVGSSTSAFSDSQATGLDVRIKSGPTYKLLTWNAAYTQQHIDYDELLVRDIDTQRISTGAKLPITPQVGLLANVGYEDNSYLTTGRAPKRGVLECWYRMEPDTAHPVRRDCGKEL